MGNFWDDYHGTDNNDDGIGDTPYVIDDNNQDKYPLTEPYAIPEFPSWIVLPLLLMTAFVAVIFKKTLSKFRKILVPTIRKYEPV